MKEQKLAQTSAVQNQQAQAPILVVDDDYHLRKTIQLMLEEEGFVVQVAADGQEAVEQATAQRPALMVLDMGLPLFDGDEVAVQVRGRCGSTFPIVLITADGQIREKSRRIGAAAYLRKPFDMDDLIQAVQHALPGH
jgi:DNA-binding response OmpR family regulator